MENHCHLEQQLKKSIKYKKATLKECHTNEVLSLTSNEQDALSSLLAKLNNDMADGNMDSGIARELYEVMRDNEILSHYTFPKTRSSDGFYHIQVKDPTKPSGRRQIKSNNIDSLRAKVLDHEHGVNGQSRKTFRDVYVITQEKTLRYVKDPNKKLSVMNSVSRHYQSYERFFVGTEFERKYIDEITVNDIEQVCLFNLERYDLRARAFGSMRAIISTAFKLAFKEHWVEENTSNRMDYADPQLKNMILPNVLIEDRAHTEDELVNLYRACIEKLSSRDSLFTARALKFQILTGLRRGEVCPLRWTDIKVSKKGTPFIEISQEMIEVKKSKVNPKSYCTIVPHTKTDKDRRIPVWDELQEVLDELKVAHDKYFPESPYLFPAENESSCLNLHSVYNFYYRLCTKLGITICRDEIKGTHSFRRNFAERIDDPEMSSKLLGNDERVLKSNYFDGLNLENAREVLSKHRFHSDETTG